MGQVNAEGAERIAKVCRDAGVAKLIHVSSAMSDLKSPSAFLQSKAEGEKLVREVFPDSIIVRPSALFGHEDRLLNVIGVFSNLPFGYPVVGDGRAKRSPLYVGDLAEGLLRLAGKEGNQFTGKTFDFIGPKSYTMKELIEFFQEITVRPHKIINLRPLMMLLYSRLIPEWRRPIHTRDSIRQLVIDESAAPSEGHLGLKDLGLVQLKCLEQDSLAFIRGFRPTYAFARAQQ